MNSIVTLSLLLSLTLLVFLILYFTPYFSRKKIRHGRFDLLQFINLFFSPLLLLPIFYFFRELLSSNPEQRIIFIPRYVSEITFMFMLYLLVLGHGIHSVSVVLSKNMKGLQSHKIWQVNEFFHHRFSHMLITVSAVLMIASYVVMDLNHPTAIIISNLELAIIIFSGIIIGSVLGLASIEGSIPKEIFALLLLLTAMLIFAFFHFSLDIRKFPYTTLVATMFVSSIVMMIIYWIKHKGFPEIVGQNFFED